MALIALTFTNCARPVSTPDAGSAPDAGDTHEQADAGEMRAVDAGGLEEAADAGPLRVLFIGNSYTYVFDVPGLLARIAATATTPPIIAVDEVTAAGATLSYHWVNSDARARIAERGWTHIIFQGQSGEPPGNPSFADYAHRFGGLALDAGAHPIFYVTWAAGQASGYYPWTFESPTHFQDELTFAYAEVARALPGSKLACVGEAFRHVAEEHPGITLLQEDASHPTLAGAYLSACTFYVALTGHAVPPESEVPFGLDTEVARALREAALIGSKCENVHPLAAIQLQRPIDFGTAGTPISQWVGVFNNGSAPATITEVSPLMAPFAWTSGVFPGLSNPVMFGATACSTSLPARSGCVLSVMFSGQTDGGAELSLGLSGAYSSRVTTTLSGTATRVGFLKLTKLGNPFIWAVVGNSTVMNVVALNRGGAPVTGITSVLALAAPFSWGPSPSNLAFPGWSGQTTINGVTYDACATSLAPGQSCLMTANFTPTEGDQTFTTRIALDYESTEGPGDAGLSLQAYASSAPADAGP